MPSVWGMEYDGGGDGGDRKEIWSGSCVECPWFGSEAYAALSYRLVSREPHFSEQRGSGPYPRRRSGRRFAGADRR